jgi:hypothetical protein
MSSSRVDPAEALLWRRLYDAALRELDPKVLTRRIDAATKAIHSRIVELHKTDGAGELWALIDALKVLADLLKMNGVSRPIPLTQK